MKENTSLKEEEDSTSLEEALGVDNQPQDDVILDEVHSDKKVEGTDEKVNTKTLSIEHRTSMEDTDSLNKPKDKDNADSSKDLIPSGPATTDSNTQGIINDYQQLLMTFTKLFGGEHERTLEIKQILATRLFQAASYEEALQHFSDLRKSYERLHGKSEPKKIAADEKSILCLIMLQRVEEFDREFDWLCMVYKKELYYDNRELWDAYNVFISCLRKVKWFTKARMIAEKFYKEIFKREIDEDDDSGEILLLAEVKMRLADSLDKEGKHQESLELYLETYQDYEENEEILEDIEMQVKHKIADMCCKVEDFETGLTMYLELYSSYMELYGGECSETLTVRTSIAAALLRQEKLEDALKIYRAVYESYLNLPDTSDEVKVHTKHIIGHIYLKEDRLFEAVQTFRDVLDEYKMIYRERCDDNLNFLEARCSLAATLLKEKKFTESKLIYEQVLEKYEELLDDKHEKTLHIKEILSDLENLDSMFTEKDKAIIEENVRVNEENHFGSQDFEGYVLPKLEIKNTVGMEELPKNTNVNVEDTDITNESLQTVEYSEQSESCVSGKDSWNERLNISDLSANDRQTAGPISGPFAEEKTLISDIKDEKLRNTRSNNNDDLLEDQVNNSHGDDHHGDVLDIEPKNNIKIGKNTRLVTEDNDGDNNTNNDDKNNRDNKNNEPTDNECDTWDDIDLHLGSDDDGDIIEDIEKQNTNKKQGLKTKKKANCCAIS